MRSNTYILGFVFAMTAIVAVVLAFMSTALKPIHDKNEATYNKRAILAAVDNYLEIKVGDMNDEQVEDVFNNKIKQEVIDMQGQEVAADVVTKRGYMGGMAQDLDMAKERKRPESERYLPVFIFEDEGDTYYIVSVRGSGLWDEIWGNIALKSDLNTIAGATFDHKAETPGLGAEIKDNPEFSSNLVGKTLYDGDRYVSIKVLKGKAPEGAMHEVDGITGATVTCNGVTEMMDRGMKYYEPYFRKIKENQ